MNRDQELPEPFVLRAVRSDQDRARLVDLHRRYSIPLEGETEACMLYHHPVMTGEDVWLVEDTAKDQVVSTLCLMPWTARFGGIPLRVAQVEMVFTHPDYRRLGLIRAQMRRFHQAAVDGGYDLCIIGGISYYYRQFGYAYALDAGSAEALPAKRIPAVEGTSLALRRAGVEDIPRLEELYPLSLGGAEFALDRSPEYWRHMILATRHPIFLLEAASGTVVGYLILLPDGASVTVYESALGGAEEAWQALALLKAQYGEEIRVAGPEDAVLRRLARSLGSVTLPGGQWLARVPDWAAFFNKIGPVLERRLERSIWSAFTGSVVINQFRQAYRLRFDGGRFGGVEALGFVDASMGADGGDLLIPPDAFTRLALGWRSLEQLTDAWPDLQVKPRARALVETLFPRFSSHLLTPFNYQGPPEG